MIKFSTRNAARSFAKGNKKVIDLFAIGQTDGKRWAVKVVG